MIFQKLTFSLATTFTLLGLILTQPARAGTFGGILSRGWELAQEEFDIPDEIETLNEIINLDEVLANPEQGLDIVWGNGTEYLIINGPAELKTIDQIVNIQQILANPEDGLDIALGNATAYIENVYGSKLLGNSCPYIKYIVPGPCPEGGEISISGEENSQSLDGEIISSDGKTIDLSKPPDQTLPVIDSADLPKTSGGRRSPSLPRVDIFAGNATVAQRDLANLYDQDYARAQAATYLGEPGDTWHQVNTDALKGLVQQNLTLSLEIGLYANQCQASDVTQDVMKCVASIQGRLSNMVYNQTQVAAQMQASLLSLQRQNAASMQLTANLNEAADESNRRERLDRDVNSLEAARTIVYLPGFQW